MPLTAYGALAYRLASLGSLPAAHEAAERAVDANPSSDSYRVFGWVCYLKGALDDALTAFRAGLAIEPDDATLLANAGELLAFRGDATALGLLERSMVGGRVTTLWSWIYAGVLHRQAGDEAAARRYFVECAERGAESATFSDLECAGIALVALGERQRAISLVRNALPRRYPTFGSPDERAYAFLHSDEMDGLDEIQRLVAGAPL